jgi:hypothetical protein
MAIVIIIIIRQIPIPRLKAAATQIGGVEMKLTTSLHVSI